MDEPKPTTPPSSDSDLDDGSTKIQVNVHSTSGAGVEPDADSIAPPAPGQVVNADAGSVDEAPAGTIRGDAEEPAATPEPASASDQPAPVVIRPGDSVAEPAAPSESESSPAASPTITPVGLPAAPAPQQQQPMATLPPANTPAAPPQVVASDHGGKGRLIKTLLLLIIIALLAVGGYFAYQKNHKTAKAPASVAPVAKAIPLLKVGINQAAYGGLYPNMTGSDDSVLVNSQLFEGLVRYQDKSKIAPDLATSWTNPDSKTWVFTIRSGVKFHDGHTLAASDVKQSLSAIIASKSALAQTFASTIASVDVVGTNQVKITTTAPDPALLNKLAFLYVVDANLPQGDEPSQAGTGPYEVKPGTTPSDSDVQMVAFDGYHGGQPTTRALEFGSTDNGATLLTDYKSGKFNIIGPVTPSDAKSLSGAIQFMANSPDVSFIGFNTVQAGPAQNKQVRQAVRYAVDAVAISTVDDQSVTPDSQLLPASVPGYNPKITPYKQDLAKAKQLLTQAGYPSGLTLKFSTADSAERLAVITDELKQAGITLTVDQHSSPQDLASYVATGKAELYDTTASSATLDGLSIYTTALPASNYSSTQFSNLLAQAATTVDQTKQAKILQTIATTVDGDAPVVPLYSPNSIWLTDQQYNLHQDLLNAGPSVYFYQAHQ